MNSEVKLIHSIETLTARTLEAGIAIKTEMVGGDYRVTLGYSVRSVAWETQITASLLITAWREAVLQWNSELSAEEPVPPIDLSVRPSDLAGITISAVRVKGGRIELYTIMDTDAHSMHAVISDDMVHHHFLTISALTTFDEDGMHISEHD